MAVELDFVCLLPFFFVPGLLHVEALVDVVIVVVLPVDCELVKFVVGVLDFDGVGGGTLVLLLPLDHGVHIIALALDCDVGILAPSRNEDITGKPREDKAQSDPGEATGLVDQVLGRKANGTDSGVQEEPCQFARGVVSSTRSRGDRSVAMGIGLDK